MSSSKAAALLSAFVLAACTQGTDPGNTRAPAPAPAAEGEQLSVASADGTQIGYRVYGHGDPTLILVHDWACDSTYWDAQLDYLKPRYTVVTLDLAGHGVSGTTRGEWSMDAFGDDVVAVASQLPDRRLILVGHAMGGPVVLEAARRLKGRVIGIIGVETFMNIGMPPLSAADLQRRLTPFRADYSGTARNYVTRSFFTRNSDPELVRRIADDMSSQPPGIGIGTIIGMNNMNYAAALGDLDLPIVALNSDLGPTDAERIRLHAATFRLKIIPGVGHFPMIEDAARCNALLDATVHEMVAAVGRPAR